MSKNKKNNNPNPDEDKGKEKKRAAVVAALLLLLLLILLSLVFDFFAADNPLFGKGGLWGFGKGRGGGRGDSLRAVDSLKRIDALRADSLRAVDSLNSLKMIDSLREAEEAARRLADSLRAAADSRRLDSLRAAGRLRAADSLQEALYSRRVADSLRAEEAAALLRVADSLREAANSERLADSLRAAAEKAAAEAAAANAASEAAMACAKDTVAPWVYPDPSGGLHKKAVSVKLVANKACSVEWSFDMAKGWKVYDGKPISISKPAAIYYKAVDACGRRMDVKSKRYEFDLSAARCPAGMEIVKAPGGEVCVDVYEWPNKKGAAPLAYVSLYQAMDSCFSARKRLCSSQEWTAACGGPSNWAYAYGDAYEWNACATRDTVARKSGSRPECRGYYGHFDMSGNLAEWTSTPAPQDKSFNNVMGGFWASGGQSGCSDARYSYFPQNRHNPVGFRCCVDAPSAGGGK
jgi:formylglycine-generating enzyme required for sulfatase activity